MNYLIGIDVGTSATKTVLFDEKGGVIASASREYPFISLRTAGRSRSRKTGERQFLIPFPRS